MPTGAKADRETLKKLIQWAAKEEILLINDNPYSFILNNEQQSILSLPGAKAVTMELNSLSKSFNMAGWRVGMLSGNTENIQAVLKVKSNMDSGMFYGIQQGAIAALNAPDSWFTALNATYKKRRKLVEELATLMNATFDPNSVGMFVWAKLNDSTLAAETYIDQILYEKDIFITPGTIFGSQGEGYIRFSLCVNEDQIRTAINRMKA
jgi:aspartate/methionine/tyrosine aminotransferase